MNNIKIVAVIVVYNKKIKESITFSRIKKNARYRDTSPGY